MHGIGMVLAVVVTLMTACMFMAEIGRMLDEEQDRSSGSIPRQTHAGAGPEHETKKKKRERDDPIFPFNSFPS